MTTKDAVNKWIDQMTDEERQLAFTLYQLGFQGGVFKMGETIAQLLSRLGIQLPAEALAVYKELMKEEDADGPSIN